jgi:hypothetical protein
MAYHISLSVSILRLRGQVEAFIDSKVMELKQSADGRGLPIETCRQILTRNDSCPCRIALNLLATSD